VIHLDASQLFFRTPEARVIYSDRVTIRAIAARSQPPTSLCVWASTSIGFSIQLLRAHNRWGIRPEPGAVNVQENSSRMRSYCRQNTPTTHFHPLRPRCCLQPTLLAEENIFMLRFPLVLFCNLHPSRQTSLHQVHYHQSTLTAAAKSWRQNRQKLPLSQSQLKLQSKL
jgi:hypothetical protein